MILTCLSVSGFRNLAEQCLQFCHQINIIAGPNGQGKTNLLEAIHVLALSRSFRTHQSRDLIRHNAARFRVSGTVLSKGMNPCLRLNRTKMARFCRLVDQNGTFLTIWAGSILSCLLQCRLSNLKQSQSIGDD